MPKLEVTRELKCLNHCDVTPSLEHHHCDRLSGQCITDNQLGNDIEADLLIRDGLNHANGDGVNETDNLRAEEN